jgi:hypothetical protein
LREADSTSKQGECGDTRRTLICVFIQLTGNQICQAPNFADHSDVFQAEVEEAPKEIESIPMAGDNTQHCMICREKFETFWDEDLEDWMLRNAIRVNDKVVKRVIARTKETVSVTAFLSDLQVYHRTCYTEALSKVGDGERVFKWKASHCRHISREPYQSPIHRMEMMRLEMPWSWASEKSSRNR